MGACAHKDCNYILMYGCVGLAVSIVIDELYSLIHGWPQDIGG